MQPSDVADAMLKAFIDSAELCLRRDWLEHREEMEALLREGIAAAIDAGEPYFSSASIR